MSHTKVPCECGRGIRDKRSKACRECQSDERRNRESGPLMCLRCGERERSQKPGQRTPRLCGICQATPIQRTRNCDQCGKDFTSGAGGKRCQRCKRSHNGYDTCECGARKDKRAARCKPCSGRVSSESGMASRAGLAGAATRWHEKVERPERINDAAGYVLLLAKGHPKAVGGRVREHVVVLEKVLDRYLTPGENVHHRNGVKDDNRPENLELWSRVQPVGARVADQVAWAREIIARYGEEFPADHDSPSNGVEPGP